MATQKGLEFITKYKGEDVLKDTWLITYRKGHITLEELAECTQLTEEEIQLLNEQIDNCSPIPTTDEKIEKLSSQILELSDIIILISQQ